MSINEIKEKMKMDIKDSLMSLSRDSLIKYALASEAYHKEINNQQHMIGGLHDYIFNLSNEQLAEKIKQATNEHKEINSIQKLQVLVNGKPLDRVMIERERIAREYLKTLSNQMLQRCALGVESFHKMKTTSPMYGGLHDYIQSLSDQEIIEYIVMEVSNHHEILTNFHSICSSSTGSSSSMVESEPEMIEMLSMMEMSALKSYSKVLSKYNLEKMHLTGSTNEEGINQLTKSQLLTYISTMLKKFPELNSFSSLESLRKTYGIDINSSN